MTIAHATALASIILLLFACVDSRPIDQGPFSEAPTSVANRSDDKIDKKVFNIDISLSPKETLGKMIFFDTNLSEPAGQSCASCHSPTSGFADPDRNLPVSEGVIPGNFGARNALSNSYVRFTPSFDIGATPQDTIGGLFWDGRKIDLEDQAKAPFLNPLEMNNPGPETVVSDVMTASYAPLFLSIYGPDAFNDPIAAYEFIADAIATYERSQELNQFSSKFDLFRQGAINLSEKETMGLALFTGKAQCAHCHILNSLEGSLENDLFTDFKYANIGLPRNLNFPYDLMPPDTIDLGLGAITGDAAHNGKFKTPHLRNVELTAPYMHNGLFNTLKEVVQFYNTRDIPGLWPAPEVTENLVTGMVGDLGLSDEEEDAIVAFMETLTDNIPIQNIFSTDEEDSDDEEDDNGSDDD